MLTIIYELLLAIKDLLESCKQTATAAPMRQQAVSDKLVQAKQEAQTKQGLGNIVAALENIMIKIKDTNRIKEIIQDVQVIGEQIKSIFSEETDVINKIMALIQEIDKLSKDL